VAALGKAVAELAAAVGGKVMPLHRGTNERGALAAGIVSEQDDLDGCEAVFCWGPGDVPASAGFVAAWDSLPRAGREADVVLPALTFAETQGSYTNVEGRVQLLRPVLAVEPPLRDGWEILQDLAQRLGLDMDHAGIFHVQREAAAAVPAFAMLADPPRAEPEQTPVMYGPARP